MMGDVLISTQELSIYFGANKAVDHVSVDLEAHCFTSILGPNGAGKTTLFSLISGLLKPTYGKVFFKGEDITRLTPQQRIKNGMGRSFQLTNVFPSLTTYENIRLAMQAKEEVGYRLFRSYRRYGSVNDHAEQVLQSVLLKDKKNFLAGKLIIMAGGAKLVEGDPETVSRDPAVLEVYLGGGALGAVHTEG